MTHETPFCRVDSINYCCNKENSGLRELNKVLINYCLFINKTGERLTNSLPVWRYLKYTKLMVQEVWGDFQKQNILKVFIMGTSETWIGMGFACYSSLFETGWEENM